jgi:CHASE2 domain-containing sensor protein
MSILNHHPLEKALNRALDQASTVPDMPMAAIHATAMDAFPARRTFMEGWTARIGALAATVVLGFGGFMAVQSYQSHQQALVADADAFAEQLLNESF